MSTLRALTIRAFLGATAMTLLVSISNVPPAFSQQAPREQALARSVGDAELQWEPCPEFFPVGCQIAVLHGDPAQRNADVFFRVPARSISARR